MEEFFVCGQEILDRLLTANASLIIVATRSVLVLFWNILKGHHPRPGGCYFERPWDNCEWVEFVATDNISWHVMREQRHRG